MSPLRQSNANAGKWFPTPTQLKDTEALERTIRQMLEQQYRLEARIQELEGRRTTPGGLVGASKTDNSSAPSTGGPSTTMICGLFVAPIDPKSLADGAVLTYVKAAGNFQFL